MANKNDYQDNGTLITFGDEGQTLRKDDPRTKEYVNRKREELENVSIFEGVNLNNKREDSETYEDYKSRLKLNKTFMKIYKKFGREKSWELYPAGFKAAAESALEDYKKSQQPQFTATMKTEDGKEIPVTIKDPEDATTV